VHVGVDEAQTVFHVILLRAGREALPSTLWPPSYHKSRPAAVSS
jgi:hypothetical protein